MNEKVRTPRNNGWGFDARSCVDSRTILGLAARCAETFLGGMEVYLCEKLGSRRSAHQLVRRRQTIYTNVCGANFGCRRFGNIKSYRLL